MRWIESRKTTNKFADRFECNDTLKLLKKKKKKKPLLTCKIWTWHLEMRATPFPMFISIMVYFTIKHIVKIKKKNTRAKHLREITQGKSIDKVPLNNIYQAKCYHLQISLGWLSLNDLISGIPDHGILHCTPKCYLWTPSSKCPHKIFQVLHDA